jgi:hypothetical protein
MKKARDYHGPCMRLEIEAGGVRLGLSGAGQSHS